MCVAVYNVIPVLVQEHVNVNFGGTRLPSFSLMLSNPWFSEFTEWLVNTISPNNLVHIWYSEVPSKVNTITNAAVYFVKCLSFTINEVTFINTWLCKVIVKY